MNRNREVVITPIGEQEQNNVAAPASNYSRKRLKLAKFRLERAPTPSAELSASSGLGKGRREAAGES
jgi:hypothetical protein